MPPTPRSEAVPKPLPAHSLGKACAAWRTGAPLFGYLFRETTSHWHG